MNKSPRTLVATDSVPILEAPREGSDFVTEVVTGESLEQVGSDGDWLEVVVPSHATRLDARGYPGWARAENLRKVPDWSPTRKVVSINEAGLPLGALLEERGGESYLPDGKPAGLTADETLPVRESLRLSPVELSRSLLGLPYRWGGTDSTVGMDCSGLVFRVMQLLGVSVPRDADDQFDRAPVKSRKNWREAHEGGELREGDLVFFGSDSITHVGFYLDDGKYLSEHGAGGTLVRAMDEDPYLGYARYLRC